ncbi:hypothetical protein PB01_10585 [Psychrobacillus glaciei]|uniref:Uncharacterized protein n=1 Tax=Psychrobacillus glaciei TaxID=2283160 RepID=A0A5J6SNN6_9BACI|nr:hypothetical protein PB01_10585 [Psychrobacillus glaciei]
MVEGIELHNVSKSRGLMLYLQKKATFYPSLKARRIKPLWSQRPWYVTHGYDTATREALPVFSSYRRVWCTSDNKQGNQMPM